MKKVWHVKRLMIVALVCVLGMAGCGELPEMHEAESSPAQTAKATEMTPPPVTLAPTPMPTPVLTSLLTPLPVPAATLPPGIREEARFRTDLNGDGMDETIIVSSVENDNPEENCNISLSVLSKTAYCEVFVEEGFFENAFLTRTARGESCLLLDCINWVGIDDDTIVCSFDGLMPVLHDSICSWIVEVDGTSVTLGNWRDAIGSWNYTCNYELTDNFMLESVSEDMIVTEGREPLHVIRELPVQMLIGGEYVADMLPAGTLVYPTTTDWKSYMDFRLEDGSAGRITYTRGEDYCAMIDGLSEEEYFDNIEYWG